MAREISYRVVEQLLADVADQHTRVGYEYSDTSDWVLEVNYGYNSVYPIAWLYASNGGWVVKTQTDPNDEGSVTPFELTHLADIQLVLLGIIAVHDDFVDAEEANKAAG